MHCVTKWKCGSTSSLIDVAIVQIDSDPRAGRVNDKVLWVGVNSIVGSAGRNGAGVTLLTLTFGY